MRCPKIAAVMAAFLLSGSLAFGQGSVVQSGPVVAGHTAKWGGNGSLIDGGLGTLTITGSPATGNLAVFSGPSSLTSGNLSGDATTSNTLVVTIGNLSHVTNGSLANSGLAHSSMTLAGHLVALGGTQTFSASDLTNGVLGSGAIVLGTGATLTTPTFVSPALGTPASGNLVNTTGYPTTSLTGLGTGVAAALGQSVSGTGGIVLTSGATLPTATIGTLTVTTVALSPNFSSQSGTNLVISPGGNGHSITFGDPAYGIGVMGSMSMGASASAASMVWNGTLQSQYYTLPGATYTLGSSAMAPSMSLIANYTGTYTGNGTFAAYNFVVPSDTVDMTNAPVGPGRAFVISHNISTGAKGGRNTFEVDQTINSAITGDTTTQQYSVAGFLTYIQANVGGSIGNYKGYFYGAASQIRAYSGATYLQLVNAAGETDLALVSGSSAQDVVGGTLVFESDHAVAGSRTNATFQVGAQPGAVGTWTNGYTYGGIIGPWPMASAATMQGTIQQVASGNRGRSTFFPPYLATYGTDWSGINFSQQSGYAFRSAGFSVDGSGQPILATGLAITASSTGILADVPKVNRVTSVAVSNAGSATADGSNNYYVGDNLYGTGTPFPGQYHISHIKVLAATVVSGGTGGVNGACTVTGTTGTGTKVQATGTVSGNTLSGALVVTVAGDYTANPTGIGLNQTTGAKNPEPVTTSCSLTGATINLGTGVLTVAVDVGDVFSACPGGGGITPTGGSGLGLTLTPTCGTRDGITLAAASTKLSFYGATPIAKATPVGACAGNTGCQALRDALGNLGFINTGSISN